MPLRTPRCSPSDTHAPRSAAAHRNLQSPPPYQPTMTHTTTQLARWRLVDATLYVTLEPCIMCAGALLQARVGTLVYGAANPLLGADGSYAYLLRPPEQPARAAEGCCGEEHGGALQPRGPHPFHPDLVVRRGVLQEPCADILRQFFRRRRAEGDGTWNE